MEESHVSQPAESAEAPEWAGKQVWYSSRELPPEGQTIKLHREELVAHKEMRHLGDVEIHTETEEVPGRLEVDAFREEVHVEHIPIERVVSEREAPRHEGDDLIVPIYEEQLVVTKRLVLREELRIRRVRQTERRLFEDTLRRERVVIEDPENLMRERYPTDQEEERRESLIESFKRKMLQP
jgi:uncharacterized protein (TIGR02271 family)